MQILDQIPENAAHGGLGGDPEGLNGGVDGGLRQDSAEIRLVAGAGLGNDGGLIHGDGLLIVDAHDVGVVQVTDHVLGVLSGLDLGIGLTQKLIVSDVILAQYVYHTAGTGGQVVALKVTAQLVNGGVEVAGVLHIAELIEPVKKVLLVGGGIAAAGEHQVHFLIIVAQCLVILIVEIEKGIEVSIVLQQLGGVGQLILHLINLIVDDRELIGEVLYALSDSGFQLVDGFVLLYQRTVDITQRAFHQRKVYLLDDGGGGAAAFAGTTAGAAAHADEVHGGVLKQGSYGLTNVVVAVLIFADVDAAFDDGSGHFDARGDEAADEGIGLRGHGGNRHAEEQAKAKQQAEDSFFHIILLFV